MLINYPPPLLPVRLALDLDLLHFFLYLLDLLAEEALVDLMTIEQVS